MPLYTVRWKGFNIVVEMTQEEREKLSASLKTMREYVDFPQPHIEFNKKIFTYNEAREELARKIAIEALP